MSSFLSWETPRTPRTPMTPFDMKYYELDDIKKDLQGHTAKVSKLTLEYQDWFSQKGRSFLRTLKHLQASKLSNSTRGISTITQLRHLMHNFSTMQASHTHTYGQTDSTLKTYLDFWDQFVALKAEIDEEVILRITRYVESVSRLRQVGIKDRIDTLVQELNSKFSEDYNFGELREKGKLYTFSISASEYEYQGLVTYLPHLLNLTTQICFHSNKIHLEKE